MSDTPTTYAYCERATAVLNTWHIRPLGERGLRPTGGIDTVSLCRRVGPPDQKGVDGFDLNGGWDIEGAPVVPDEALELAKRRGSDNAWMVCPECAERLAKAVRLPQVGDRMLLEVTVRRPSDVSATDEAYGPPQPDLDGDRYVSVRYYDPSGGGYPEDFTVRLSHLRPIEPS